MNRILSVSAVLLLISGCAWQQESVSAQNWGRSYEMAKYNQILNPDAGKNLTPVEGLDGKAAENAVEKYENSFKKDAKQEGLPSGTFIKF